MALDVPIMAAGNWTGVGSELLEGLPNNDLNTVPGEGEWSIAQILDHLIIINSSYFPFCALTIFIHLCYKS